MTVPAVSQGLQPRTLPMATRTGLLTMGFGFLFDLVEHTLVFRVSPAAGGFPLEEHAAHLIVVIGMALVLVGIVRDGIRQSRTLHTQEETPSNAIR